MGRYRPQFVAYNKSIDSIFELAIQQRTPPIHVKICYGRTPFLEAAYKGRVDLMQRLLDAFPNDNLWEQYDEGGNTLFHLGFYYGSIKSMQLNGEYAISTAKKHDPVLEFAFKHRTAPIHIKNSDGRNPFLEAAAYGQVKWMQHLLDDFPKEELWEQQDIFGNIAFNLALQGNHDSVLQFINQPSAVPIHIKNSVGRTPFFETAYYGRVNWMQRLLEIFPDQKLWDQQDRYGNTTLHLALLQKNDAMIDFCLSHAGTSCIQKTNHQGYSLLHIATQENLIRWISPLISTYTLAVNQADNIGTTPAMIAACHGYLATLKLLAEFKADLTLVDAYDDTAFTIAEYNSREEIVEWLITQGYCPSSETLTSPCAAKIHPDVAAWLDKYGSYSDPDGNWVFHIAARYGDLPTLVAQLHQETSHHKISILGKPLFLIAVRYGHEHILDWLSRRGFYIESEEDYEEAIVLARDANQSSSLWFMINQKKCDIHIQESTILVVASYLGHETIVSELLDRHPIQFFQRYQQDGSIALYAAIAAGHSKIVNRLLKAGAHFKSCITQYDMKR